MPVLTFRTGSPADTHAIMALFDANIAWLVERSRPEQWGSDPWSTDPAKVELVGGMLRTGVVTIAQIEGEVVGASVVSDHPMPYVPPMEEPERYLKLLIVAPTHRGQGIGHRLIEHAREHTEAAGIDVLRVDCWSGGDRRLVQYYIDEGFTPTVEIEVRPGTSVQVFAWRAGQPPADEPLPRQP